MQTGTVPHADGAHKTVQFLQPGIGGGDGSGDNGNGNGNGGGSPDIPGENACNNNGGIFMDLVGGLGVQCAGEPKGPSEISGGVRAVR